MYTYFHSLNELSPWTWKRSNVPEVPRLQSVGEALHRLREDPAPELYGRRYKYTKCMCILYIDIYIVYVYINICI